MKLTHSVHNKWHYRLEIEADRARLGNAVYCDLIQALVMVEVVTFVLAVLNTYRYTSSGRSEASQDYENPVSIANARYEHSQMRLPYNLVVMDN